MRLLGIIATLGGLIGALVGIFMFGLFIYVFYLGLTGQLTPEDAGEFVARVFNGFENARDNQ